MTLSWTLVLVVLLGVAAILAEIRRQGTLNLERLKVIENQVIAMGCSYDHEVTSLDKRMAQVEIAAGRAEVESRMAKQHLEVIVSEL